MLKTIALALALVVSAQAACDCVGLAVCLKTELRDAFQKLQSLSLEQIPDECKANIDPEKVAELQGKIQKCMPVEGEEPPESVQEALIAKADCAVKSLQDGCEKPNFLANRLAMLFDGGKVPLPGCDADQEGGPKPPFAGKLPGMGGSCNVPAKLKKLKEEVTKKFPELQNAIQCLKKNKCTQVQGRIESIKTTCVDGNDCKGANVIGGLIKMKRSCMKEGPAEEFKTKFTQICKCLADQLGLDASVKTEACEFSGC